MQKNQLFLHIGTHKTGTTTIQQTLIANAGELKKENIIYLGKYKPDIIEIAENHNLSDEVTSRLKRDIRDDIQQYEGQSNLSFIITNEKLAGDKRSGYKNSGDVAAQLKNVFQGLDLDVKVVVYFRRHDDFLESLYSQRIYNGSPLTFDEFIQSFDETSFSWQQVADSYAEHFGKENIIVRRYYKEFLPELDSIIHDFGNVIDSHTLKNFVGNQSYNMGYTNSALRLIGLLEDHLEYEELRSIKKLLRKGIQKDIFEKYALLNYEQRKKILDWYQKSNEAVARQYLGIDSGNLFPEIEDEYKRDQKKGVDQKEMAVNFAVAFHHLYQTTNSLEARIKKLEHTKTLLQKIVGKIRRAFSK